MDESDIIANLRNAASMLAEIRSLRDRLAASLARERTLWVTCEMAERHLRAGKLGMATQILADATLIDNDDGKPMPLDMEEPI